MAMTNAWDERASPVFQVSGSSVSDEKWPAPACFATLGAIAVAAWLPVVTVGYLCVSAFG